MRNPCDFPAGSRDRRTTIAAPQHRRFAVVRDGSDTGEEKLCGGDLMWKSLTTARGATLVAAAGYPRTPTQGKPGLTRPQSEEEE